jgi:hypothetical protein
MWAVYAEMVAPVSKSLELSAALRHDRYQTVGGSTTPKLGLRWTLAPSLLVRASAGTGFRAPSVNDLYRPVKTGQTAVLPDPVCMAENDNDLGFCADFWETRTYANPKLKPEKSRQQSVGLVFQPTRHSSLSVDYWAITKRDLISTLGDDVILANLAKYEPLVHRYNEDEGLAGCDYDPDDSAICFIELQKENRGRQKLSGVDIQAEFGGLDTALGRFGLKLAGTYCHQLEEADRQRRPLHQQPRPLRHRRRGAALAPPHHAGLGTRRLRPGAVQHLPQRPHRPELGHRHRRRLLHPAQQGQGLLAVGPERALAVQPAVDPARRREEPARHRPALLQPGLFLPERLRPELHRPARAFVLAERQLQVLSPPPVQRGSPST